MKKLRANAMNGLRYAIETDMGIEIEWGTDVPKELAAQVSYKTLNSLHNVGKKSIVAINEWLSEDGLSLKDMPLDRHIKSIEQAIKLLQDNGYQVTKI